VPFSPADPQAVPPLATETATAVASPTPVALQYALIGKARGEYWASVERGALAAERQLGLPRGSVLYYAPEQDDPAAQILAVERFAAQKVRGIALAPSDSRALEYSIQRARDAGVWLVTFDTDAPDSRRLFFVGTPSQTIGRAAAGALLALLGERGGKVALGSTLLDAAAVERIAAFKDALAARPGGKLSVLDASNDRHDSSVALQAARTSIANNKDLVGAFGVYAYNGAAWCRALKDAQATGKIVLIGFEVNTETAGCLKEGALGALLAPRPYDQGLQSVLALDSLARQGLIATMQTYHFDSRRTPDSWVVDVGVDVVSAQGAPGISLADYAARLDGLGVPHEWQP
jgi:ribose transport system substrate-binding protein